jgi:hypothetical protein
VELTDELVSAIRSIAEDVVDEKLQDPEVQAVIRDIADDVLLPPPPPPPPVTEEPPVIPEEPPVVEPPPPVTEEPVYDPIRAGYWTQIEGILNLVPVVATVSVEEKDQIWYLIKVLAGFGAFQVPSDWRVKEPSL